MVAPLNRPSSSFPSLARRRILGTGQAGRCSCRRVRARGPRAIMPWAASPPRHFCQDQVTTSSLAQGRSMAKAALVASQMVRPPRSSAIQAPSGTRTPLVVPFQTKTRSRAGIDRRQVRQLTVVGLQHPHVRQRQLPGDVGGPARGEALPDQHVHAPAAPAATTGPSPWPRCPIRARWPGGGIRAGRAGRRCARWPRPGVPCPRPNDGNAPRRRRSGPTSTSPGAWRTAPRRSGSGRVLSWSFRRSTTCQNDDNHVLLPGFPLVYLIPPDLSLSFLFVGPLAVVRSMAQTCRTGLRCGEITP